MTRRCLCPRSWRRTSSASPASTITIPRGILVRSCAPRPAAGRREDTRRGSSRRRTTSTRSPPPDTPAAGITVWVGPDPAHASETNVLHVYNAVVTWDTTRTNSTSWGDCEQDLSSSFRQSEENIFKQAAAQGQSFFAASGDYGNIDCY